MTRSKRMQPVRQVAESRENSAVRQMGESRQQLAYQEARLQELRNYREQYTQLLSQRGSDGLNVAQVRDYRMFLSKLNDAIKQQEAVLVRYRDHHEQSRDNWVDTRRHSQVVDKLIERFRNDEKYIQQRREQQATDEHVSNTHHRTNKN